jgi:hypothetical protein
LELDGDIDIDKPRRFLRNHLHRLFLHPPYGRSESPGCTFANGLRRCVGVGPELEQYADVLTGYG